MYPPASPRLTKLAKRFDELKAQETAVLLDAGNPKYDDAFWERWPAMVDAVCDAEEAMRAEHDKLFEEHLRENRKEAYRVSCANQNQPILYSELRRIR